MRSLIASAPHADTFGYSMPPPGLLRLGGALEAAGQEVWLEDLAQRLASGALPGDDGLCDAAAELLLARGPVDVLGLSCMGATLPAALAIAERYRAARPATPIVLGGPGAGGVEVALLERFRSLDVIVRGEGERTAPELFARLAQGASLEGLEGITWRAEDGAVRAEADRAQIADLRELPDYAWHLLPPLAEYKRITGGDDGLVPLDSGRGCAYDCSFCSIGRYWRRRSRPLPAARLVEEVLAVAEMPAGKHAYLCHDLFGAVRGEALEFCERLEALGAPVPWECRARLDHLDAELLQRMAAAGCYRVLLGVESGSPAVRRANQKGMRDEVDVLAAVDACAAAGITPILSLILGLPGEGDEELNASLELCADAALRAGVNLSLHLANPQPGCALGEEFAGNTHAIEGIPPDMAFGAGETATELALREAHPDLFSTWHLLPIGDDRLRFLSRIARELPVVLMRYPRCFALLRRRRNESALVLWRTWKETGRSFESFVRAQNDAVLEDALRWEQAVVRASARGNPASDSPAPDAPSALPRPAGELVELTHDIVRLVQGDAPQPGPVHLFVQATPGALAGTRSLQLGPDVVRVLSLLDGRTSLADLDAARPGLARAVSSLSAKGLVEAAPPAQP